MGWKEYLSDWQKKSVSKLLHFITEVIYNNEISQLHQKRKPANKKAIAQITTKYKQMGKVISFMHMSLDGFVAGPNGEMNWIKVDEEIFDHIGKRIGETDTALYGRITYEMMEGYWPAAGKEPDASKHDKEHSAWYNKAHKLVLSKTKKAANPPETTVLSENIAERIDDIKQQTDKEILLFGSPTATHSLMQLGLIDGYWLFVNPIILGQGIPLFADVKDKIKLQLISTRSFTAGVTELNYVVDKQ